MCLRLLFAETVKDLIRFLKREDETCDIRRQLGHAQILQNDLIPIIKTFKDDRILWETVIRFVILLVYTAAEPVLLFCNLLMLQLIHCTLKTRTESVVILGRLRCGSRVAPVGHVM